MHTTDAPASAAEQHTLALDSTVPPLAGATPARGALQQDATPTTGVSPRSDATAPDASHEDANPAPVPSTPAAPAAPAPSTNDAQTLARLIADGRKPRSLRFTALEPYRDVLLIERRAGASIRLIAQSLAKLDVAISEETLRVWFLKEQLPMRRRPRKKRATTPTAKVGPVSPTLVARPVTWSVPTPVPGATGTQPGRRGPKIARDNY
jgi:hypothetical protein